MFGETVVELISSGESVYVLFALSCDSNVDMYTGDYWTCWVLVRFPCPDTCLFPGEWVITHKQAMILQFFPLNTFTNYSELSRKFNWHK